MNMMILVMILIKILVVLTLANANEDPINPNFYNFLCILPKGFFCQSQIKQFNVSNSNFSQSTIEVTLSKPRIIFFGLKNVGWSLDLNWNNWATKLFKSEFCAKSDFFIV